jgi:proline dehydrogenase
MLRTLFLYLSRAGWAKNLMMQIGPVRRTAHRFIAGDSLEEAILVTRKLNERGFEAALDLLGESVTDEAGALQAVQDYLSLLDTIATSGIRTTISLKLTQLGLDIREDLCIDNMSRILTRAKERSNHVTIDMESTQYTEAALRVYRALRSKGFDNVGIAIQAYLYRSEDDVRALAQEGAVIRLCKGAYQEPPHLAFPDKADVDANYIHLVQLFLNFQACAAGAYLGIATHDEKMIRAAKAHIRANNIPYESFEFQMLYGIRSKLQEQLRDDGYKMRVYVPYGTSWYPYFMRRLAERPANVWFVAKNLFYR